MSTENVCLILQRVWEADDPTIKDEAAAEQAKPSEPAPATQDPAALKVKV